MGEVRQFPTQPLTADEVADIRSMFTRPELTLDEARRHVEPASDLMARGPRLVQLSDGHKSGFGLLSVPFSRLVAQIRTASSDFAVIAGGLTGGSAVKLDTGLVALRRLVAKLQRQVGS